MLTDAASNNVERHRIVLGSTRLCKKNHVSTIFINYLRTIFLIRQDDEWVLSTGIQICIFVDLNPKIMLWANSNYMILILAEALRSRGKRPA